MKSIFKGIGLLALSVVAMANWSCADNTPHQPTDLVKVNESTIKPWAYWWWMGNSVTKEGITKNLESYHQAGFGGMHIIPIYGEKGDEKNFIQYLSPEWMDMLVHTLAEAKRLGMQIDMTTGTGWPFGGPGIDYSNSSKALVVKEVKVADQINLNQVLTKIKNGKVLKLIGVKADNKTVQLPLAVTQDSLIAIPEAEQYSSIIALVQHPTRQKVKRAAPGGEGLVVDYFNRNSLSYYMQRFDSAFHNTDFKGTQVRSFYNDSYEVYGANFTTNFFEKFKELRKYDFLDEAYLLKSKTNEEDKARVICDYGETISDLLLNEFTKPWVEKSHELGTITRNQAHGSPANILDLYAAADIPETESFGSSGFDIPGVRRDEKYNEDNFGRPTPLVLKFASSPAHVYNKPLVASETTTWLADHFKVALSQIKPQVDELFVSGINHIIFHGITYTPPTKEFPGRLFYASTNYGPYSHFYNELPALNRYIANCQRILQQSRTDNDVLLYLPMHDIWSKKYDYQYLVPMKVHNPDNWLNSMDCGKVANNLWKQGFGFDYVSDRMLSEASVRNGELCFAGGTYKAIVIPECTYVSEVTMAKLKSFMEDGVKVIFHNALPQKVNGYYNYEKREQQLAQLNKSFSASGVVADDVLKALQNAGIQNEEMSVKGLSFIRKQQGEATVYYVTNLANEFKSGEIALNVEADRVVEYNPMNGEKAMLKSQKENGKTKVYLQLEPGQSCFLMCSNQPGNEPAKIWYAAQTDKAIQLKGEWKVNYVSGVPAIKNTVKTKKLVSWTNWGKDLASFSGKMKYSLNFKLPAEYAGKAMLLDLGDVRETADVTINGKKIGLLWCVPYRTVIPEGLLKENNKIDIVVTNLSLNRVIDLDKRNVKWKNYYEINFVNIRYKKFDASQDEPVPSGLLGEVSLIPVNSK